MTTASFRTILAINKYIKGTIRSSDVPQAFTKPGAEQGYGTVYFWIPADVAQIIVECHPKLIKYLHSSGWMLAKAVKPFYGMRGAPLFFNRHISTVLISADFKVSTVDPCVFYQTCPKTNGYSIVGIHVDDLLNSSNSPLIDTQLSNALNAAYGVMPWATNSIEYLGMHIHQNSDLNVDMAVFIANLLNKYSNQIHDCRAIYPSDLELFKTIGITEGTPPKEEDISLHRSDDSYVSH